MGSDAEDRVTLGEDVSISERRSPLPKSSFLACPPGYCAASEAITSPVFDIPWDRLREYWMEMIAGERERLTGVLDVYLSSVANRTTEATRTLTLLGTIALPALVISSFFGMSIPYPAWTKSPWALAFLAALTVAVTGFLLWYLKRNDYLPGGSTAPGKRDDH